MFTGIIKDQGNLLVNDLGKCRLRVQAPIFSKLRPNIGASIALDGVCLSAVAMDENYNWLEFDLGHETKKMTLLGQKTEGMKLNIEPAILASQRIDGHFVQGHVDAISELLEKKMEDDCITFRFSYSEELDSLIVTKGSIAINGVSMTVNEVDENSFQVCAIPITLRETNLGELKVGDKVHIESDILGRYALAFLSKHLDK